MGYNVEMLKTDNPYVDGLVYYTKILAYNTVLKNEQEALKYETLEISKNADLYIHAYEQTAKFEFFDNYSYDVIYAVCNLKDDDNEYVFINPNTNEPYTLSEIYQMSLNKSYIPEDTEFRDKIVEYESIRYLNTYEEENEYYRLICGMPPIGKEIYINKYMLPEDLQDMSVFQEDVAIHKLSKDIINILSSRGILDEIKESAEDKNDVLFLDYINKDISIYKARKSVNFSALYIPTIDNLSVKELFTERLEVSRQYALNVIYSEAYKYSSDYYDAFIALLIVITTMIDIISRVNEFIVAKEIFDVRTVQFLFEEYGIRYYDDIPLKYQEKIAKNSHTLLKCKSTPECMIKICSLFGYDDIKIYKYEISKDNENSNEKDEEDENKPDDTTPSDSNEPSDPNDDEDDENNSEGESGDNSDQDWIKTETGETGNGTSTSSDTDPSEGDTSFGDVENQIEDSNENKIDTKYISIDILYNLSKLANQQSYFFNLVYSINNENVKLADLILLDIPYLSQSRSFKISNLFIFLNIMTFIYFNIEDRILDTETSILHVNGFNFYADLDALKDYLDSKIKVTENESGEKYYISSIRPEVAEEAYSVVEGDSKFINKYNSEYDTIDQFSDFEDLINTYKINMNARDIIINNMFSADNYEIYNIFKKLYTSMMEKDFNMSFFKNPSSGELYKDDDGNCTYTEYLKNNDLVLYNEIVSIQALDSENGKTKMIKDIDAVISALNTYLDTDDFSSLFKNVPAFGIEAVRYYIKITIEFFMSFKVTISKIQSLINIDSKEEFLKPFDGISSIITSIRLIDYIPLLDKETIQEEN